ncbi:MAG: YXWGXW repeat-containing protein [Acidobacteriota bacterium]|nr:YXWGXW repeat-containing protein [Acidobacteriota bacterium]
MKTLLCITALAITLGLAAGHSQVFARFGPPPPRREVVVVRPGPRYVWVPGYYTWAGERYAWRAGYWAMPPRPYAAWVPGTWRHRHRGYVWVGGYWR